jgi:hypothetical protein
VNVALWKASNLAPDAEIQNSNFIDGSVFAASLNATGELHNDNLYDGGFPPVTPGVPEPSTWAMMLLGFAGLGFAEYRCSQAKAA